MEFTGCPERPTGVRRMLYRLPVWLYRARLGVLLGKRFVLINHVGRKTGRLRQVVVEVVDRDPATGPTTGTVTVASGFGPDADWYRNLLAHPEATIQLGSRSSTVRAVPLSEDEAAEAMARYAHRHPRAARGLSALMGFRVDGSESDYLEVGRRIPMLRLEPLGNVGA